MRRLPDLHVSLGSLTLPNPVIAAAGTLGYGLEFARHIQLDRLGALVTKTLTRQPREGNPPPRLVATPAGLLNAVGLQNIGLEAFLSEKLPALRTSRVAVIVSILGDDEADVAAMTQRLDSAEGVAAIELNLSCPNIKWGHGAEDAGRGNTEPPRPQATRPTPHRMVAQDPEATAAIVRAARQHTRKAVIAKLSPDVTDLAPIARAAEADGADALTIGNTFAGMSIDPQTRRSRLGVITGGVSGPAIRPLAVYRVWYTAQIVRIPIIGLGGIVRAEDAMEFFLAGASAVAVGTGTFANPRTPLHVLRGVERHLMRQGVASIAALRGAVNR